MKKDKVGFRRGMTMDRNQMTIKLIIMNLRELLGLHRLISLRIIFKSKRVLV